MEVGSYIAISGSNPRIEANFLKQTKTHHIFILIIGIW